MLVKKQKTKATVKTKCKGNLEYRNKQRHKGTKTNLKKPKIK